MQIKSPFRLVVFFLFATGILQAQVRINEYSCANLNQFTDNFQKYEDWIELHNGADTAVNLGGYFLSDNPTNPEKWEIPSTATIPANGFIVFWASGRGTGLHTNFKFSQTKNTAESIVLTSPNGTSLDEIEIKKTKLGHSRGRSLNGTGDWVIFADPTNKTSNDTRRFYTNYADRPDFSQSPGFYNGSVTVGLINNEPGAVLHYTVDGTPPSVQSPVYVDPIEITSTTVLKAMAVIYTDSLSLSGFMEYGTFFVDVHHTLPVFSFSGAQLELLANGNNALRPHGAIEYFDVSGDRKASTVGEFNSHGQDSWVNDQRSLDLIARDEMGYSRHLKEKMFSLSDREEFQRLILRAAGDDNYPGSQPEHEGNAHVRDAYVHNLAKRGGLHLDVRLSEKAILYINGVYWGVYDIREIPDDHDYTDYYYDQGKYDIQYILTWDNTWAEYGGQVGITQWKALRTFIFQNDMSNPAKFEYVESQMDVKSLVDYVIVNSVTVCSDWLNYNTGWWRGLNPDGTHKKWGYILWDNDATFGYYINYTGIADTSATAPPCQVEELVLDWSDPERHIRMMNKMMENPGFKQYYQSRYIDLMNTVFSCENMLDYLNEIVGTIAPEMPQHINRWGGTVSEWEANVERLRNYIQRRCTYMESGIADCYNLTGPYDITFDENSGATLPMTVNSLEITQLPYTGRYYGDIDIKVGIDSLTGNGKAFQEWVWTDDQGAAQTPSQMAKAALQVDGSGTVLARFDIVSDFDELIDGGNHLRVYPTVVQGGAFTANVDLAEATQGQLSLVGANGQRVAILSSLKTWSSGAQQQTLQLPIGTPAGQYYILWEGTSYREAVKIIVP